MSELAYKRTNLYEVADEKKMKEIFAYLLTIRYFCGIIYNVIKSDYEISRGRAAW